MGNPEAVIVSSFKGIHRPGLTSRISTRRVLDEPREMYNFHLTDDGHLYMPDSPSSPVYDFSVDGNIKTIHYVETPRGIVVQMDNGKLFFIGIDVVTGDYDPNPISPVLLATIPAGEESYNIWVNSTLSGYFLMGYSPRGTAGPATDGKTWKVSGTNLAPVVTDLTSSLEDASWSTMYKGRRWWVKRGRTVYFSPLNQPDQPHGVDDTFTISGDDAGNTFVDNPGNVLGLVAWEDVLIIFLTGSVWMVTGSDSDTFTLRQVQTIVGNDNSWSLVRTDRGVITLGGRNLNDVGVYLFTGSNAVKLSGVIDNWFRSTGKVTATLSAGRYVLSCSRSGVDNRQFLILDLKSQQWTAFDGWELGTACVYKDSLFVSKGGILYRSSKDIFPRAPGRGAKITLGYHDDENPSGLNRYLGLKIAGRYWGTGVPSVTVTATTSDGQVVSGPHDIPTDVFDNVVIPLNIRGAAVEFLLDFTVPNDDNELLIENLQVIVSRKGEKISRG